MQELPFPEKVFKAHDFVCHDRFGVFDRQHPMLALLESHERAGVELLLNNKLFYNRILAVDGLKLKVGAKVILLKHLDLVSDFRLVNGSVGTIIRWATGPEEVDFDSAPALTPGSMSPTKQRAEAQEHKETYVKKWLRDHPTDVPIVSRGVLLDSPCLGHHLPATCSSLSPPNKQPHTRAGPVLERARQGHPPGHLLGGDRGRRRDLPHPDAPPHRLRHLHPQG